LQEPNGLKAAEANGCLLMCLWSGVMPALGRSNFVARRVTLLQQHTMS
jgi:hypothetical protein